MHCAGQHPWLEQLGLHHYILFKKANLQQKHGEMNIILYFCSRLAV
jgi:hypothetical protein